MQVSVETLKGLERKVTVSVPAETLEEEVGERLRDLARKVKIDGFRPGKVPFHVVKKRYSDSVRMDVARDLVQSTLADALEKNGLVNAGMPDVEIEQLEEEKEFKYHAIFEVFPEVALVELSNDEIEMIRAQVQDSDIDAMLTKLQEQNKEWRSVERAAQKHDKIVIDFEGFIDDKLFEGGAAKHYEIIIGSGSMIPGFEEGLIGGEKDKTFDIQVKFPDNYGQQTLAGKEATFKITVHEVLEGVLPSLDDDFAEKFNITEGGVEGLKKDIKENMERELERRISSLNREKIFDKLLSKNSIELPQSLIEREIEHLKHDMYHRLFGPTHSDDEKMPDFPRSLFEEQAKRRVHLGLVFSEYVKKHEIVATQERVDAMIDKLANAYEHPDELRAWYQGSKERLAEIQSLVTEEMVAEKISENAKLVDKEMNYEEVMNPTAEKENTKEGE